MAPGTSCSSHSNFLLISAIYSGASMQASIHFGRHSVRSPHLESFGPSFTHGFLSRISNSFLITSAEAISASVHAEMITPSKMCLALAPAHSSILTHFLTSFSCLSIGLTRSYQESTAQLTVLIASLRSTQSASIVSTCKNFYPPILYFLIIIIFIQLIAYKLFTILD